MDDQINPYEPPGTASAGVAGMRRSIRVGTSEVYTVHVTASLWTGLKTFAEDEQGQSGPVHRGPAEFEVGDRERHTVRVAVDGHGRVGAYVDGTLVDGNLFSRLRIRIFVLVGIFMIVVAVLSVAITLLLFEM